MNSASAPLSERERATLVTVCEALLPAMQAGEGESPALFSLDASTLGVPAAAEEAMRSLSSRQLKELRLFLRLLESRLFMAAAARKVRGMSLMSASEREDALLALSTSWLPQARSGFQALKRLATFLFYALLDERRANPTWAALRYAVPAPVPAVAALELTRVTRPTTFEADVCVIGSGAGGSVVAAQLAAAGRRVVVLEAGAGDQAPEFDHHEIVGMQRLYLDQGTTATRDLGVAILAGSCVGGGTTVNWQTSLRTPEFIRHEWAERSGVSAFAGEAFTSALDAVCERLSVGITESVRNAGNDALQRGATALGYAWSLIPRNSRGCDLSQCSFCVFGCRVGGKQSTAVTFLRDAMQSGNASVVPQCHADRLRFEVGHLVGVDAVAVDPQSGARHAVRVDARTVVVAAGALETPALLLRSGIEHPQLGRNLFLHPTTAVGARYHDDMCGWIGAPQTVLVEEFGRLRGNYGFRLETPPVHPGLLSLAQPWAGAREHRAHMQHLPNVGAFIVLSRDRGSGRVRVDGEGRPVVDYRIGRMERGLLQRGIAEAVRVHWAAGAEEVHTLHTHGPSLARSATARASDIDAFCTYLESLPVHANRCAVFSAHQMGTARMGTDARRDVCDATGQVHGTPGLYVADASLFPASSGVNPMITIMALAHMVGSGLASR